MYSNSSLGKLKVVLDTANYMYLSTFKVSTDFVLKTIIMLAGRNRANYLTAMCAYLDRDVNLK